MKSKIIQSIHQRFPKYLALFAMLFLALSAMLPKGGHGGDIWCWTQWLKFIQEHGLANVYKSGTDYLPLFHYILFLFAKFAGSPEMIDRYINYLKIITLCFDFLAGYYLIKILNQKFQNIHYSVFLSMFLFLNPAFLYDTIIWNQVDGIMACLVLLSFYYATRKKITASLLFFVLAINFKLQSIIFLPLLGLMLLPEMVQQFSVKKLFEWILSMALLQFAIVLPFVLNGDGKRLWDVVTHSVGKYPVVSMNAYNFWHLVLRGDLMQVPDRLRYLGITYKSWGLILFFISSFWALWPLLKSAFLRIYYAQNIKADTEKLLLTAGLIPMLFFFLNTEMHERYLHPAILFLAAYSLISGKYIPYILCSLGYLLNLEGVLQYWGLKNYHTVLFHPSFVAALFLGCIIYCFVQLYSTQVKIQESDKSMLKR